MPACGSPKLIAACHVLHRLLLPRHPPCALSSLTTKFTQHTQRKLLAIRFWLLAENKPQTRRLNSMGLCAAHRALNAYQRLRAPAAYSQALIKIYNALYFAQSIQLSNIVLAGFRRLTRFCRYGSYSFPSVQTLEFLQPNVRRQTTFLNRDTGSVVVLAPNIRLMGSNRNYFCGQGASGLMPRSIFARRS